MTRLKLKDISDEKPVRLTVELSARLHRDLLDYAKILGGNDAASVPTAERLIPPMIERFIATDRSFSKLRRAAPRN